MANSKSGKVVVMGKSKRQTSPEMIDILSTIEPTQVPHTVLDQVFVTLEDQSKYQLEKKHFKDGIDYAQINNHVKAAGAKSPIELIEVIIDIDYVTSLLEKETNLILDRHFA